MKTTYPPNYTDVFVGKAADKRFNDWQNYVAGIKPKNLPKIGGAGFKSLRKELEGTGVIF